ncbi:MAG: sugar phosphate isomerase [Bacilli bacterium]|nr:sugar phosphate isomerase [Bacilli bacterium]
MTAPKIAIQARVFGLERVAEEYPQVFNEMLEAGYAGAEVRSSLLDDPDAMLRCLAERPAFTLLALHTNLKSFDTDDRKEVLQKLLERMNRAGSKYLLVSMGREADVHKWFQLAAEISEQCAEAQIQFCYHNHAGEFANGDQFFDELTGQYKVALAADLAWVHRAGRNVVEFVDRYADAIQYVHVKDTKGEQWKELGEGEVNLKPILERVTALNLPWWTVEQDSTDQEPLLSATISRTYLKKEFDF